MRGIHYQIIQPQDKLVRVMHDAVPDVAMDPSHRSLTLAKRPQNSCLSNEKLDARFTVRLAPWEMALDEAMRSLSMS
jgi:dTDP-4-dehydrorhamnose reductase